MLKLVALVCFGVAVNALQCPVCSVSGDPSSCDKPTDCHQDHDVCEMMLHLREQNRIEFTCRNKPACTHQEVQDCDINHHERCSFCCSGYEACQELVHSVFGNLFSTTTPTTTTTSTTTTSTTTTTTELIVCESAADVLLILDSSGSIGRPNYALLSNFSAELSKDFQIGSDKVQFSALLFSSNVQNVFNFNTYNNNADVAQALLNIPYLSATTNTADALNYARTTSFSTASGARPNVGKIAVVITDGNSNDPVLTAQAAAALKQSGVTTIAVGVGTNIAQSELLAIASSPSDVFNVNDFSVLEAIKKGLVQTACHGIHSG
ncbi:collagen alpha-1(XII) chain [Biomphalaria pfeifferi]|uniref:Collagen alpha-1(XII) chain n=1 Tax=Biomphalaria pfeifferi TaxID=112525 RepID=A0AAD8B4G5_BIOPF|nr:collagen alpha-1(XII) chain [Biomphalaria pfeifferi]